VYAKAFSATHTYKGKEKGKGMEGRVEKEKKGEKRRRGERKREKKRQKGDWPRARKTLVRGPAVSVTWTATRA